MRALTGIPDTDILILLSLDDTDLLQICKTNKYTNSLCFRDSLWIEKINRLNISNILKSKPKNIKYRDYYFILKSNITTCSMLKGELETVQLIYDDLYVGESYLSQPIIVNPYSDQDILDYLMAKMTYNSSLIVNDKLKAELELVVNSLYSDFSSSDKIRISEGLFLTTRDKNTLREYINEDITIKDVRKNIDLSILQANRNPLIYKSDEDILFLIHIHNGLRSGKLPINILWKDLCSHSYVLTYI